MSRLTVLVLVAGTGITQLLSASPGAVAPRIATAIAPAPIVGSGWIGKGLVPLALIALPQQQGPPPTIQLSTVGEPGAPHCSSGDGSNFGNSRCSVGSPGASCSASGNDRSCSAQGGSGGGWSFCSATNHSTMCSVVGEGENSHCSSTGDMAACSATGSSTCSVAHGGGDEPQDNTCTSYDTGNGEAGECSASGDSFCSVTAGEGDGEANCTAHWGAPEDSCSVQDDGSGLAECSTMDDDGEVHGPGPDGLCHNNF